MRRQENKYEICLPKARGLGYLWVNSIGWSEVQGRVIWRQEKGGVCLLCAGISELHASSWDACSENGAVSMMGLWWSFWPSHVKSHPSHTRAHPVEWSVVLTSLNWAR